ncbi:hypothetical protein KIN20_021246 [Parelaphostrongylus tenuis]|uniref:Uncharacterized protein n=1 Tax=Parelaphostrongylus tenuis TaxID=148309 RepID=A0AAD5MTW6_PARTN|nr:hypothetical protein KIN20_021246 [Parelaphostrongylus tenuis]
MDGKLAKNVSTMIQKLLGKSQAQPLEMWAVPLSSEIKCCCAVVVRHVVAEPEDSSAPPSRRTGPEWHHVTEPCLPLGPPHGAPMATCQRPPLVELIRKRLNEWKISDGDGLEIDEMLRKS